MLGILILLGLASIHFEQVSLTGPFNYDKPHSSSRDVLFSGPTTLKSLILKEKLRLMDHLFMMKSRP